MPIRRSRTRLARRPCTLLFRTLDEGAAVLSRLDSNRQASLGSYWIAVPGRPIRIAEANRYFRQQRASGFAPYLRKLANAQHAADDAAPPMMLSVVKIEDSSGEETLSPITLGQAPVAPIDLAPLAAA